MRHTLTLFIALLLAPLAVLLAADSPKRGVVARNTKPTTEDSSPATTGLNRALVTRSSASPLNQYWNIAKNGDLFTIGDPQTVIHDKYGGLDGNGNPIWDSSNATTSVVSEVKPARRGTVKQTEFDVPGQVDPGQPSSRPGRLILTSAVSCVRQIRSVSALPPRVMCLLVAPRLIELTSLTFEPVSIATISGRSPMRRLFGPVPLPTSLFPSHILVTQGAHASR